jgi:aflatoxin B1 aldehyde reductase
MQSFYISWVLFSSFTVLRANCVIRTSCRDDLYFDALDILRPVIKKHELTESECGLRWLAHHSKLKKELGDAVIVGASCTKHLEENLAPLDKGPLPEEVVQALDAGWARVRGKELKFWH